MNKQEFVEYLRTPNHLNAQTLVELESVIEDYPYFQSARTLLAKGSKQVNPKKAGHHINMAAIYATDRMLLKRYLSGELIFLNRPDIHESHEAELDHDVSEVLKTNKIEKAQVRASRESEVPPKKKRILPPSSDESELTSSTDSELDGLIEDIYKEMEALKVNRAKLNEIENRLAEDEAVNDALQRVHLIASPQEAPEPSSATEKATAYTEEKDPATPEAIQDEVSEEHTPDDVTFELEDNLVEFEDSEDVLTAPEEVTPAEEETPLLPEEAKVTPASTLRENPKESPHTDEDQSKDEQTILQKPSLSRSARVRKADVPDTPYQAPANVPEVPKISVKDHKAEQSQIIANFIRNNPSIGPADSNKAKNDADLSTNSTALHPDIASEYLAEIYLQQGRKERAIQIYEALVVKYPEKSVYFADIIKKLNE